MENVLRWSLANIRAHKLTYAPLPSTLSPGFTLHRVVFPFPLYHSLNQRQNPDIAVEDSAIGNVYMVNNASSNPSAIRGVMDAQYWAGGVVEEPATDEIWGVAVVAATTLGNKASDKTDRPLSSTPLRLHAGITKLRNVETTRISKLHAALSAGWERRRGCSSVVLATEQIHGLIQPSSAVGFGKLQGISGEVSFGLLALKQKDGQTPEPTGVQLEEAWEDIWHTLSEEL